MSPGIHHPVPLLAFTGPKGVGKSTAASAVRHLVGGDLDDHGPQQVEVLSLAEPVYAAAAALTGRLPHELRAQGVKLSASGVGALTVRQLLEALGTDFRRHDERVLIRALLRRAQERIAIWRQHWIGHSASAHLLLMIDDLRLSLDVEVLRAEAPALGMRLHVVELNREGVYFSGGTYERPLPGSLVDEFLPLACGEDWRPRVIEQLGRLLWRMGLPGLERFMPGTVPAGEA